MYLTRIGPPGTEKPVARIPPGVGMGFDPPVWLRPGDVMEFGITGLGTQRQKVLGPR